MAKVKIKLADCDWGYITGYSKNYGDGYGCKKDARAAAERDSDGEGYTVFAYDANNIVVAAYDDAGCKEDGFAGKHTEAL